MKRNLFSALAVLTSIFFISSLSSCGDSYSPITLTTIDGKTVVSNNDTIKLTKFTEGEQYNIKGGNGKYIIDIIENDSKNVITYNYNGEVLTISPVKEGSSYLQISDSEDNLSRIIVAVQNKNRCYIVKEIKTNIIGGELTQNQINEINSKMMENSIAKIGGRFEFTYISKDFNNGNVSIWASEDEDYISGIFNQNSSFDDDLKLPITEFTIMLPSNNNFQEIVLNLYEQSDENKYILSQDVTDIYKGQYSKLEEATMEYILEIPSETAKMN